jgi:Putative Actinobacterial Holin-X, holin superfamily III
MAEPAGVQGWIELFRSLGEALFEVLRAEAEALGEDFRRSGRDLARALALLGGAAAVGFWTLGVVVAALVAVLAIWLQPWAAALIAAAIFAAVAGLLAALGLRRLRRLESPAESVRRRVSDHVAWWRTRLLAETAPPPLPAGGGRSPSPASSSPSSPPSPRSPSTPSSSPPRPPGGLPPRIHPDDPLEEDDEP